VHPALHPVFRYCHISKQKWKDRMQLKTILNRVQKFKSFVYESARWDESWIGRLCLIVTVVPRANNRPICSGCERTGAGYDTMKPR